MGQELEKVISWLEAGEQADYRTGVLLLQDHSGNRSLVNLLLKKESATNRDKLRYELVKVGCKGRMEDVNEVLNHFAPAVQGAAVQELVLTISEPGENQTAAAPEPLSAKAQAQVEELTQRMQQVYNQRCQLSNSLAELTESNGPLVVAEILQLQEQYNDLAEQRRRLVAGQPVEAAAAAPADAAAPVVDRAKLLQQRGNLRSQVSKAKAAAAKKPEDQLKAEKVAKLQAELDELELQIKQLPA